MELTAEQKEYLYQDFEEIPVSIEQFITDRNYMGNAWLNSKNQLKAFPFWVDHAKQVFPLPMRSPYNTILYEGGTGLGKTSVACCMIMAYYLHIVLCLRDPHEYFDLADQKNITFAVLNIVTKTMAYKNAWGMLQKALVRSPWFMARGKASSGAKPEWECTTKPVELLYGRCADDVIGLDLLCCFLDEVNFARIRNVQAAQERATEIYNAAIERMNSRFTKFGGLYEGLMLMASSKRTDQAFLEQFTEKLLKSTSSGRTLVIDKPRWEVLPESSYSGVKFPVAVGDKFRPPQIITKPQVEEFEKAGYKIIYPPIENYGDFERDIISALTNVAGISVTNFSMFLSGYYVKAAIDKTLINPFRESIIYVGNKDKTVNYWDYFDLDKVPEAVRRRPLFVHLDASLGGDGNVIYGVIPKYAKMQVSTQTGETLPELHYQTVFKIKVRAPKGDKVSLIKNTQFIFWLKQQGFNIAMVTHDQYQSAEFHQALEREGIPVKQQSIDKVTGGINLQYAVLKDAFYEGRIKMFDDEDTTQELVQLEKHGDGVVDKPQGGSDDAAQGLCGAVFAASQAKAEFLRDYGILMEAVTGTRDIEAERHEIERLFQQQFNPTDPFDASKLPAVPGLRETFDEVVGNKNKEGNAKKQPGPTLHIF